MGNHIFMSYRWKDFEHAGGNIPAIPQSEEDKGAKRFKEELESVTGLEVFLDRDELGSGDFQEKLRQAIEECYVFMPVASENYLSFASLGDREEKDDYCLWEYKEALRQGKKIVPVFVGDVKGDTTDTGLYEDARRIAQQDESGEDGIRLLRRHLLSLNGINLSSSAPLADRLAEREGALRELIFDSFCSSGSIPFFKKVLETQSDKLDSIRGFGEDINNANLTLSNSFVPQRFQRLPTREEREEKERIREPFSLTEADADKLLSFLESERFAVVVGDVGQGKSSFAKKLCTDLAKQASAFGLSRDLFFPLFLECRNLDPKSFAKRDLFLEEIARDVAGSGDSGFARGALEAVMRNGKPLFIFDALDEISPALSDKLIDAVYRHLASTPGRPVYIIFTTRPGQKHVAEERDMLLDNASKVVRRYSVRPFDEEQRDGYAKKLAAAKGLDKSLADRFIAAVSEKEKTVPGYTEISRNPFMLLAIFSGFAEGEPLPDSRFDAVERMADSLIRKDLFKGNYPNIRPDMIKTVLGDVSCRINRRKDENLAASAGRDLPYECAKEIYHLSEDDPKHQEKLDEYNTFFSNSQLFDSNGFKHEFLSSTYASYYLYNKIKNIKAGGRKRDAAFLELLAKFPLCGGADYWKSAAETLLCMIDKRTLDAKSDLEPLLAAMQERFPDYDLICRAVSQFKEHKQLAVDSIVRTMLGRGCRWLENKTAGPGKAVFSEAESANPYRELFYYAAVFPFLRDSHIFGSGKTAPGRKMIGRFIAAELISELRAVFSDKPDAELKRIYYSRKMRLGGLSRKVCRAMEDAAADRGMKGFVRIRENVLYDPVVPTGLITALYISDSVTELRWGVFSGYAGLQLIVVDPDNEAYFSAGNCIIEIDSRTLICGCKNSVIPDGVKRIGRGAFWRCAGLTGITIPDSVAIIGEDAFVGCIGVESLTVPGNVIEIGRGAFEDCSGLRSLIIQKGVERVGADAFDLCSGLTSVTISEGVKEIGGGAFYLCTGLCSITIPGTVEEIGDLAFANCTGLTNVVISEGVKEIGVDAFAGCFLLTSVTIPGSVKKIGAVAFTRCAALKSVNVPEGVRIIDDGAFSDCSGLSTIIIARSVERIGNRSFQNCTALKHIIIPDKVNIIGGGAFYGCTGLTKVVICKSVTEIGTGAFSGCSSLAAVLFIGSKEDWDKIDISPGNDRLKSCNIIFKRD